MSIVFYIIYGVFALAGGWAVFNYCGYKLGHYLMDRHYTFDVMNVHELSDYEQYLDRNFTPEDDNYPLTILNPARWHYFQ